MSTGFPVATGAQVRAALGGLLRRYRGGVSTTTAFFWAAAAFGLAGPWLLGRIVDAVSRGGTAATVTRLAAVMLAALVGQAVCTFAAHRMAVRLGERIFAQLRADFVGAVTRLPLSDVESAGTGDLLTRTTRDVGEVSDIVRYGVPQVSVSVVTIAATCVACVLTGPLLSLALLAGLPLLVTAVRWFLRRSTPAYRRLGESYSDLNTVGTANVASARTIDALQLGPTRRAASDESVGHTFRATMGTLYLKTVLFPATNFAYSLPVLAALLWGGWLVQQGRSSAGAVATVTLYVVSLAGPVDSLIGWLTAAQPASVALARLIGVQHVPDDRVPSTATPDGPRIELRDVTFAYRPGEPVLRGITLDLRPGERLAIVGPSGSGKSTLARIITGINRPDTGSATVGGIPLAERSQERLRRDVALVTQEHHVFRGSIADNVRLGRPDATDDEIVAALRAVDADWVSTLDGGIDTVVGAEFHELTPAQAQQLALARLLLLGPRTLVLDEATAMIDPTSARSLERSMAAAVQGRTVVAIAHRLHTAYDADRVAVVIDGRLVEIGPHEELLAHGGEYSRLWHAWQDD